MDVIIPLGGKGERFTKEGFLAPKPLIKVGYKEMIRHVIDHLTLSGDDRIIILYHDKLDTHEFSNFIRIHYPNVILVPIPFQTRGAVETLDYGLRSLSHHQNTDPTRKCLILDCDAFYTEDIVSIARHYDNAVFVFDEPQEHNTYNTPPKYSYVSTDPHSNRIVDIAEKSRISGMANTGAYLFKNRQLLLTYTEKVLEQDFRFCNEFYTSCVIKLMLNDQHDFRAIHTGFVSLGTPSQLKDFLKQQHAFLFDLDGTLIDTTDVYVKVWDILLRPYHVNVDHSFFKAHIDGNNDERVLTTLIPKLDLDERKTLSSCKDRLFIEFIDRLRVIDGAIDFLKKIRVRGHPIAIVTNCNRLVAEKILSYCGLDVLVDILIVGNECERPKPHPDPYQKAKDVLACGDNVIIFEDSNTGFLSARGVYPKCIVGINSQGRHPDVFKPYSVNILIDNYLGLSIEDVLSFHTNNQITTLENRIFRSIAEKFVDIDKVVVYSNKLKGGYIADVVKVDIVFKSGQVIECIAKLQSEFQNNLSDMANNLGLYQREHYFYESIRDHICIKAPRFYGTIRDENVKQCGILLEYLPSPQYSLGIDFEKAPLDLTLNLVKKLASHHARFWGKDLLHCFPQLTKNNDPTFFPSWGEYVRNRWPLFKDRWASILTADHLAYAETIVGVFDNIQNHLSQSPLTLCHGDVKSPNIFFKDREPYFIDWQYIIAGKGVQDLVFLMIESFSPSYISKAGNTLKDYYYLTLLEEGVAGYSKTMFETDFQVAMCYFPFFVAIWFGTTPPDQLIDVNFPFFFIQKMFAFMDIYLHIQTLKSL